MFNVNPLTTGLVVFVPYGMINSGGFRPSSKGGGVVSKQNFRASTWSKHKGGTWAPWVPPLDPPLTNINFHFLDQFTCSFQFTLISW